MVSFLTKTPANLYLQGFSRGDPVGIQTQDLQNRNLTLYSAKLRDLTACKGNKKFRVLRLVDGVL